MDLDKIKKEWQATTPQPMINEEKINRMIGNEGKSAHSKLLRYEILGLILMPLCIAIAGSLFKYKIIVNYYIISCIICIIWQIYKIWTLKKIDVFGMDILTLSRSYLRYRKYILYEIVFGVVWFIMFAVLFGYQEYIHVWTSRSVDKSNLMIGYILILSTTFVVLILFFWLSYWKNLRKLGDSINKLNEYERDNV